MCSECVQCQMIGPGEGSVCWCEGCVCRWYVQYGWCVHCLASVLREMRCCVRCVSVWFRVWTCEGQVCGQSSVDVGYVWVVVVWVESGLGAWGRAYVVM